MGTHYTCEMEAASFHDHTSLGEEGCRALTERRSCCWPVSSVFVFCIPGINYVNQLQWTSVSSSKLFLLRWKGEIETSKENKLNLVCLFQQNMFFLVLVQNVLYLKLGTVLSEHSLLYMCILKLSHLWSKLKFLALTILYFLCSLFFNVSVSVVLICFFITTINTVAKRVISPYNSSLMEA